MENVGDYRIKIVTGRYQKAPYKQKKVIKELFGEDAEYNYEIYFHWYNVIHELGHAIIMFNASSRLHPAKEEQLVNNFAYAYWKYYGEEEKLNKLSAIVDETISKFTIPAYENESYMDYAERVWGTDEMLSFNNYGWFQFSSVQSAINKASDLEDALNAMCSFKVMPQKTETLRYEIYDQTARQVLADAVKLIKRWGVALPESNEVVFCDDVNCHMCQAEKLV